MSKGKTGYIIRLINYTCMDKEDNSGLLERAFGAWRVVRPLRLFRLAFSPTGCARPDKAFFGLKNANHIMYILDCIIKINYNRCTFRLLRRGEQIW